MLLDAYDKFDFIKVLLKNQHRIVFCTKLARAETARPRPPMLPPILPPES